MQTLGAQYREFDGQGYQYDFTRGLLLVDRGESDTD